MPEKYQHVIDELQAVIDETQQTVECFEVTRMYDEMSEGCDKLLVILTDAVTQQREHTLVMVGQA